MLAERKLLKVWKEIGDRNCCLCFQIADNPAHGGHAAQLLSSLCGLWYAPVSGVRMIRSVRLTQNGPG